MTFADLHHGPRPLVLPNAWDVASALAFAEAWFPAVGTTSFGVSAALGTPRGARVAG
jgi:2-methylisocitrate lyase-like PEP mutase family enzyme